MSDGNGVVVLVNLVSITLLIVGVAITLLGGYATIKRFASRTDVSVSAVVPVTVSFSESLGILMLGIVAILAAVVVPQKFGNQDGLKGALTGTASPSPTASPSSGGAAPSAAGSVVVITSPEPGTGISARDGVKIEGTATNLLADETVWLLDYDPSDKQTPYYGVNDQPIEVHSGRWSQVDAPIGDESDPIGRKFYVVAVKAGPTCTQKFMNAKPNRDGNITFSTLGDDCYLTVPLELVKERK